MKFMKAHRIAPDGTPRCAASHLGLFRLPMSHKKNARLIWVKLPLCREQEIKLREQLKCQMCIPLSRFG